MFLKPANRACHLCFGDVCETAIFDERKVSRFLGIDFPGRQKMTRVCRTHLGELVKQKLRSLKFDSFKMIVLDPVPPLPVNNKRVKELYFQYFFRDIPEKAAGYGDDRKEMAEDLVTFNRWFSQLEGSCLTCHRTADTVFFPHDTLVYDLGGPKNDIWYYADFGKISAKPLSLCHQCAFDRVSDSISKSDFEWPEGICIPHRGDGIWFTTIC